MHFWFTVSGLDTLPVGHLIGDPPTAPVFDSGRYRAALSAGKPLAREMFTGLEADTAIWPDATRCRVDTIILATGYHPNLGRPGRARRHRQTLAPPGSLDHSPGSGISRVGMATQFVLGVPARCGPRCSSSFRTSGHGREPKIVGKKRDTPASIDAGLDRDGIRGHAQRTWRARLSTRLAMSA